MRDSSDFSASAQSGSRGDREKLGVPPRKRRGVPALLDWIDEAEAVNRPAAERLLVAALIAVAVLLLFFR